MKLDDKLCEAIGYRPVPVPAPEKPLHPVAAYAAATSDILLLVNPRRTGLSPSDRLTLIREVLAELDKALTEQ